MNEECFDHRFTDNGIRYGFCKKMVAWAKEVGAMAVGYVKEDHIHEDEEEDYN